MIKTKNMNKKINIEAKELLENLSVAELTDEILKNKEGVLTDDGALMLDTGKFTGRSPKDRFIVYDDHTKNCVHWSDINLKIDDEKFNNLLKRVILNLKTKKVYSRNCYACAHPDYRLNIKVYNTKAWQNLFCYNMFLRPEKGVQFEEDFTIICDPDFKALPEIDGTSNENFAIINLTKKILLIGGTEYSGEIKKGIFSYLNYKLPYENNVLSMHCSANVGKSGDTALFFGLSGTGKTTLSTDHNRLLVGDDEHGWTEKGEIFNFEGGCYAKVFDISLKTEPDIYKAIKFGAILENTRFKLNTRKVNYQNRDVTRNTRVSYPIYHINTTKKPSRATEPKNIFFLTADRLGVLPPVSKLTVGQAMYHFLSGYTSKVAGTEQGIEDPTLVFSSCYGEPFLPLNPIKYAEMLGEKIKTNNIDVWLINTGWTGGSYGIGERIKLKHTRTILNAILNGSIKESEFYKSVYNLSIPMEIENVPEKILNPEDTWENKTDYWNKADYLSKQFENNFKKYKDYATDEIINSSPK